MKITKVYDWLGAQDKAKKGSAESKLVRPSSINLGALVKTLGWQVLCLSFGTSPRKLMPRLKMIFRFCTHVNRFARFHGDLTCATYLKASLLALQRCIAGQKVSTLRELEPELPLCRLSRSGLPKIIGTQDRRLILRKHQATITLWISLLSLYRIFECPVKAKTSTITEPFNGDSGFAKGFEEFVPRGIGIFKGFIKGTDLPKKGLLPITKASPVSKVSFMSLQNSLLGLKQHGLLLTLIEYIQATGNSHLQAQLAYVTDEYSWMTGKPVKVFYGKYEDRSYLLKEPTLFKSLHPNYKPLAPGTYRIRAADVLGNDSDGNPIGRVNGKPSHLTGSAGVLLLKRAPQHAFEPLFLTREVWVPDASPIGQGTNSSLIPIGRLSPKEEAAGKLRIFAMVDIWTQCALYPLHSWLFDILRRIPNDGTFDQESSVERGWAKAASNKCSYGYDLSAATDRLPLNLQVVILSQFFGTKVATLWSKLLVDRPYHVIPKHREKYGLDESYRYAVGQPMGAYSSWAMLAITHHYIVQMSALHAGVSNGTKWWEGYELLGDDINIFDSKVASIYLQIMRGLGVAINEKKSVIDLRGHVTEFAKRTAVNGLDVSGISWAALQQLKDAPSRLTYALSLSVRKKVSVLPRVAAMLSKNMGMLSFLTNTSKERAMSLVMSRVLSEGPGSWRTWIPFLISKDGNGWVSNRVLRFPLAFSTHALNCAAKRKSLELVAPSFQTYIYDLYKRALDWAFKARVIALMPRVKALLLAYPDKWSVLHSYDMSEREIACVAWAQTWKHINAFRVASGNAAVESTWDPYLYNMADHPVLGMRACLRAAIEDSFFDVTYVQTLPIESIYRMLEVLENLLTVSAYPKQVKEKLDRKKREVQKDDSGLAVKILAEMRKLRASSPYGVGPIGYKTWPRYKGKGGSKRNISKVA